MLSLKIVPFLRYFGCCCTTESLIYTKMPRVLAGAWLKHILQYLLQGIPQKSEGGGGWISCVFFFFYSRPQEMPGTQATRLLSRHIDGTYKKYFTKEKNRKLYCLVQRMTDTMNITWITVLTLPIQNLSYYTYISYQRAENCPFLRACQSVFWKI